MKESEFPTHGVTIPSFVWAKEAVDVILSPDTLAVITVIATFLILWRTISFVNDVLQGGND